MLYVNMQVRQRNLVILRAEDHLHVQRDYFTYHTISHVLVNYLQRKQFASDVCINIYVPDHGSEDKM